MLTIMVNIIDIIWSQVNYGKLTHCMIVLLRSCGFLPAMHWSYIKPNNPNPWLILPPHFTLALRATLQALTVAVSDTQFLVVPMPVFVMLWFL